MKKILSTIVWLSMLTLGWAQEPPASNILDVNNIQARFNASGALFTDFISGQFSANGQPSTINSSGFWIGGVDPAGNLKGAYQLDNANGNADFLPGLIDVDLPFNVIEFNKIWKVTKEEVLAHQAAYAVSVSMGIPLDPDLIPEAIKAWPGRGNPLFFDFNGFEIPNAPQGLAPFWDNDGDGIYNPIEGDYPILGLRGVEDPVVSDQMLWFVFNDIADISLESSCDLIEVEVQAQAFAFSCSENEALDNTIFVQFKPIFRGVESLDSLKMGVYANMNIGCPDDDYFGTIAALNTLYVYNSDAEDEACGDMDGFEDNPPVQAMTLMRGPFEEFGVLAEPDNLMGFRNDASDLGLPDICQEFYSYLTGSDLSQTPLGFDGAMYNGNPNNQDDLTELSAGNTPGDRRVMGAYEPIRYDPGAVNEVIVAYTFYQSEGDNLESVSKVYSNSWQFHQLLEDEFANPCAPMLCEECVWPGDTDRDEMVTNWDILPVGLAYNTLGTIRENASTTWMAQEAEDWPESLPDGTNYKHIDANGDGNIDLKDVLIISGNYALSNVPMGDIVTVPVGEDLYIQAPAGPYLEGQVIDLDIMLGSTENPIDDIYGLAFSLLYDHNLMYVSDVNFNGGWITSDSESIQIIKDRPSFGRLEIGVSRIDHLNANGSGSLGTVQITIKDDIMGLNNQIETALLFANLKAVDQDANLLDIKAEQLDMTLGEVVSTEHIAEQKRWFDLINNPAKEWLHIEIYETQIDQLEIRNAQGQVVWQKANPEQAVQIPVHQLSSGLYLVSIQKNGQMQTQKLIVQ
jgi:hypothetical protein